MSCLRLYAPRQLALYWPAESVEAPETDADESGPVILKFPRSRVAAGSTTAPRDLLERARLLHENRCCPECGRAAVVPVEATDLLWSRNGLPIPGTGTLVGFQCEICEHEWDATR
jgi:rubredoxin